MVYVKQYCPFCMQVRIFLVEVGLSDRVELREMIPGSANEQPIRKELEAQLEKVSFPACQIRPGEYIQETDNIIAAFATGEGIDRDQLPTLKSYVDGPFKTLLRLYQENIELKKQLGQS